MNSKNRPDFYYSWYLEPRTRCHRDRHEEEGSLNNPHSGSCQSHEALNYLTPFISDHLLYIWQRPPENRREVDRPNVLNLIYWKVHTINSTHSPTLVLIVHLTTRWWNKLYKKGASKEQSIFFRRERAIPGSNILIPLKYMFHKRART